MELNKEPNIEVKVRLISKGNDEPVSGDRFRVRLYDKDVFNDDYLGESHPDKEGIARFIITGKNFSGTFSLDERPDFYFVVYRDGQEVFKSKVMSNLDITDIEQFVMKEGEVIDLGTFLISTGD